MNKIIFIKFLKMSPSVNYCDENECNLLHKMIEEEDITLIKKFLDIAVSKGELEEIINKRDNDGRLPLHYAVENNRQDVASLLVKYGADTNVVDVNGKIVKWVPTMNGGGRKIKITGWRKID